MALNESAHGRLWYDDFGYRLAWLILPQALAMVVLALVFWRGPGTVGDVAQWGEPLGSKAHVDKLNNWRDKAGEGDKDMLALLQKASDGDDLQANFKLATLYDQNFAEDYGKAGLNDPAKAVELYKSSLPVDAETAGKAERNMASLILDAGLPVFDAVRGCELGKKQADEFVKLAEAGGKQGWIRLRVADCLAGREPDSGRTLEKATKEDLKQALDLYKAALLEGARRPSDEIYANRQLGIIYELGNVAVQKDPNEAFKYYKACAEKEDADCLNGVAYFYENGLGNTPRDPVIARGYYERSSKYGNPRATAKLGLMYLFGQGGLAKDSAKAYDLGTQAMEKGDNDGAFILALIYWYGDGRPRDVKYAAELMLKTADLGGDKVGNAVKSHVSTAPNDPDFWRTLQLGLQQRGTYDGPINGKPSQPVYDAANAAGQIGFRKTQQPK